MMELFDFIDSFEEQGDRLDSFILFIPFQPFLLGFHNRFHSFKVGCYSFKVGCYLMFFHKLYS